MPGMPAPAFSFPDTTGTQISLVDFKGKYVYIDVWATWCYPCIREIPKLKELEQEFGDEIAFLSISIDDDKERWHKYVKEKALTGVQILSLPQIGRISSSAEIMELYMIQGIPRFIMIDPDGNLIDADASRPSDEKTKKIFKEWTSRNADDV
jgi:thiol-disulfide isomerase/thioredoxin